jgi:phage terminase Nu1 subunit (DNA packaging protein)
LSDVIDLKTVFDLSKPVTQRAFAALVGVSEMAVSDMKRRGVIIEGQPAGEWLTRYCNHLRETAAGRAASEGLDLPTERAKLAKEQRERIAMQNAVTRKEFAPIAALETGLCDAMAKVASQLETIPAKLKIATAKLTADDLDQVTSIIAQIRNDIANMDIDYFDEQISDQDDIDV